MHYYKTAISALIICIVLCGCTQVDNTSSSRSESSESPPIVQEEKQTVSEYTLGPYDKELSEDDCTLIMKTLIAECRGETFIGQLAVAQCIRNMSEYRDLPVSEVIDKYGYAKLPDNFQISDQELELAAKALDMIFIQGACAVPHRILYFYNPEKCQSDWHESLHYITTIGNHKFFDER